MFEWLGSEDFASLLDDIEIMQWEERERRERMNSYDDDDDDDDCREGW